MIINYLLNGVLQENVSAGNFGKFGLLFANIASLNLILFEQTFVDVSERLLDLILSGHVLDAHYHLL